MLSRGSSRGSLGDTPYAVITPSDPKAGLPLILVLHGANSSAEVLAMLEPIVESLWADGTLPPCILACASTPTVGGFYIGQWESFVAQAFPDFIVREFGADPDRVCLLGSSMGGYGALKIAFASPRRWRAVAAIAPAVLPLHAGARNTIGVLAQLAAEMPAGDGVLDRLRANASAIRGLPIFLRCGDRDMFNLHDGTELVHRALWDLDIGHDYHLVHGADHVGPEAPAAQRAALAFLGAALGEEALGEEAADPGTEAAWRKWMADGRQGSPPPLDPFGPAAPPVMRLMMEAELASAARQDPDSARRYGILS